MASWVDLTCARCGSGFRRKASVLKAGRGRFCSRLCSSIAKRVDKPFSYREFGAGLGGRRITEHRRVVEESLGRTLSSDEIVHHVNGDKTDNRLANLEITSRAEHAREHHTRIDVARARALRAFGATYKEIAEMLGCHPKSIPFALAREGGGG